MHFFALTYVTFTFFEGVPKYQNFNQNIFLNIQAVLCPSVSHSTSMSMCTVGMKCSASNHMRAIVKDLARMSQETVDAIGRRQSS